MTVGAVVIGSRLYRVLIVLVQFPCAAYPEIRSETQNLRHRRTRLKKQGGVILAEVCLAHLCSAEKNHPNEWEQSGIDLGLDLFKARKLESAGERA